MYCTIDTASNVCMYLSILQTPYIAASHSGYDHLQTQGLLDMDCCQACILDLIAMHLFHFP